MKRFLSFKPLFLGVGVLFLAICAPGLIKMDQGILHGYLIGWMYWMAFALGSLGILMINHASGGRWGVLTRRPLEAAAATLPLCAILFLPILFGAGHLYEWAAHPDDHHIQKIALYLNRPFFTIRFFLYFAIWIFMAERLRSLSRRQDAGEDVSAGFQRVSAPGILVFFFTATFALTDWMMSLEPKWFSTVYGAMELAAFGIATLSGVIVLVILLREEEALAPLVNRGRLHQLGKLLFAFIMFFAYLSFSQFILIWSANLAEEAPWYLRRSTGGWMQLIQALSILHFAAPFLILLSQETKKRWNRLIKVAAALLIVRWFDLLWILAPALRTDGFSIHWIEVAATLGVGGLWMWLFASKLASRPLSPVNDPLYAEACK